MFYPLCTLQAGDLGVLRKAGMGLHSIRLPLLPRWASPNWWRGRWCRGRLRAAVLATPHGGLLQSLAQTHGLELDRLVGYILATLCINGRGAAGPLEYAQLRYMHARESTDPELRARAAGQ